MTTKYNIGDKVWIMFCNEPVQLTVYKIIISSDIGIEYYFKIENPGYNYSIHEVEECHVALSKRDLLNSFLTEEDKL